MDKTILFWVRYQIDKPFHLKGKFDGQIQGASDLEWRTMLLCFDRNNYYIRKDSCDERIGRASTRFPFFFHFLYYLQSSAVLRKWIMNNAVECLYFRLTPGFFSIYRTIKAADKRSIKVICEIPSYYADPQSGEKALSAFRAIYQSVSDFWIRKMSKYISLYTLIGDNNPSGIYLGRPSVNISNAINVDTLPLRTPVCDLKVHILALGAMGNWHGFDRMIRSAAEYRDENDYVLHMVGGDANSCLEEWKALAADLGVTDRIVFHGPLYGKELNAVFDLCDIGISSLGAFRVGVNALASLKLREYAARGLPFVYAADDSVIDNHEACKAFSIKIPNDNSIPNLHDILVFARKVKQDMSLPAQERAYAKEHMQWQEQFSIIFNKMSEIEKD